MILLVEGVVMCFVLLLVCVIGIANGPVGLVVFYEQEVKNRVIELGLTTIDRIKKTSRYISQLPAFFNTHSSFDLFPCRNSMTSARVFSLSENASSSCLLSRS